MKPAISKRAWSLGYLSLVLLWLNIGNEYLSTPDGPHHAALGKILAGKPFREWIFLTWDGTRPYFDHPHLVPWLMALSVKIFGATTIAALLPSLLFATATVFLVYRMGTFLLDEDYGLIAATLLILTPRFIRMGRNPMIEAVLCFLVFLTIDLGLRALRSGRIRLFVGTGLAFALAFMTKGPTALLAPASILAFWTTERWIERTPGPVLSFPRLLRGAAVSGLCALSVLAGLDLWYSQVAGGSFYLRFVNFLFHQQTDQAPGFNREALFYVHVIGRHFLPWWPLLLLAPFLGLRNPNAGIRRATWFSSLAFFGTVLGFSLIHWRNDWYVNLGLPAFALLVAVPFRIWLKESWLRSYSSFALGLGITVATLCAINPKLFEMARPDYGFLQGAEEALGAQLQSTLVADCMPMHPWTGPFLFQYYLGAIRAECGAKAPYAVIRGDSIRGARVEKVLYSREPFLFIQTGS